MSRLSRTRKLNQGSRKHDLLGGFVMILGTWYSVTGEKVEKVGGRIPGEIYCKEKDIGNIEWIFSVFSVKNSANHLPEAEGVLQMGAIWRLIYVTHILELAIVFVGCDDFRADSIVLINFLHVLWPVE